MGIEYGAGQVSHCTIERRAVVLAGIEYKGGTGGVHAGRCGGGGGREEVRVANGGAAADGHVATAKGFSSGLGMSLIACHPKAGKG